MTLTTQCPYCKTSFRVTETQLAQHNGSVRCGVCSQVFNGHDYLQKAEDDHVLSASEPTIILPSNMPSEEPLLEEKAPDIDFDITEIHQDTLNFVAEHRDTEVLQKEPEILLEDPVDHHWDMQSDHALTTEQPVAEMHMEPVHSEQNIEPVLINTSEKTAQDEIKEETEPHLDEDLITTTATKPNFIEQSKRREKRRHVFGWVFSLFSVVLLFALLMQGAYFWRHQIIAAFPASQSLYIAACKKLNCTIGLETKIDDLSLESNDLQAVPDEPNAYQLNIIVKNNSNIPQTWPHIELSLKNQSNTTLIRKVFTPKEYLALPQLIDAGILNQMEQPITVKFTLPDNAGISGYQVYLFYP